MLQPPGIDTTAFLRFAKSGPIVQMLARIVFTMS
jgi:hypothetical protein